MSERAPRIGGAHSRFSGYHSQRRFVGSATHLALTGHVGTTAVPRCPKCGGHTSRAGVHRRACAPCGRTWGISFNDKTNQWTVSEQ